jgi:hypothetical protein
MFYPIISFYLSILDYLRKIARTIYSVVDFLNGIVIMDMMYSGGVK